jgi:hypothetical protein
MAAIIGDLLVTCQERGRREGKSGRKVEGGEGKEVGGKGTE